MKIELRINNVLFKDTKLYAVLYEIICVLRFLILLPLSFLSLFIYAPLMFVLGISNSGYHVLKLIKKLTFNK